MTRKKVKFALIENNTERKASYKKRKKGLFNKAHELTTLCGVETATVVYSAYYDGPEVYPDYDAAVIIFTKFRELSEENKSRNMMSQEDFTKQRIKKLKDKLRKVRKENRIREFTNKMYEVLDGKDIPSDIHPYNLNDLSYVINQTLKRVKEAIKAKVGSTSNAPQHSAEPGETTSEGPSAPLLDPLVAPTSEVVLGETPSEEPSAPLLDPLVASTSEVVPPSSPNSPSLFLQMFPPMVPQLYPPSPPQMVPRRAPRMAPPTPPPTMAPPMSAPAFPPMDPSMNSYQNYSSAFPQSPALSEMLNWNDEVVTLLDDPSFINNNAQDPNNNNNNF